MSDFYGNGLLEEKYKDPTKYRGRGRPRKIDYSPLSKMQKVMNRYWNNILDKRMMEIALGEI